MKFIVDEMPIYPGYCPFYRVAVWVNDCTKRKHACILSKECCDLTEKGCEWLKPIEAEEEDAQI